MLPRWYALVLLLTIVIVLPALLRFEPPRPVTGAVRDSGGFVPGAVVRLRGSSTATLTNASGRFRLALEPRFNRLTAAKEGFLIASAALDEPHLLLERLPTQDHDDYAWIDPTPNSREPNNCGNCHDEIYREWSASAHGNSASNPRFREFFAGAVGQAASLPQHTAESKPPTRIRWNLLEEHPLGSGVCASCHAPTLNSHTLEYDVRQAKGVARHGVHCDYCHKIAAAPVDKLGTRFGRDGYALLRPGPGELLVFGPLDDAFRPGEKFAYAPFYRESRYCASCHEGIIFGVHVYGTYSEWLESPARRQGKHCQDCHMAPTGKLSNLAPGHGGIERNPWSLASHRFAGATPDMLRRSLKLKVHIARRTDGVGVHVELQADDVGHRVPTGFIDRHLALVVEAKDAAGEATPLHEGPLLPVRAGATVAGKPGLLFGKQHLNAAGAPLPFWLHGEEILDTRLRPGEATVQRFEFAPATRSVRVRLLHRRFWDAVARERDWRDNDIVVADERREVP
jgi:hypothetical protein